MCHRKHYTWLFLRTECLACSLCCFRVDFTCNDCTRADIHVWVLRLLRWTSHQESRPSQLSAFGKHVPIRNGALRTGTKPSSAHPDTCVCSVTLESCLQEGTPSVTPPPGAQPQEGCHELLFPWHLQTKRWPPKRGCSATWGAGLQRLAERTGSLQAARLEQAASCCLVSETCGNIMDLLAQRSLSPPLGQ